MLEYVRCLENKTVLLQTGQDPAAVSAEQIHRLVDGIVSVAKSGKPFLPIHKQLLRAAHYSPNRVVDSGLQERLLSSWLQR